MSFGIPNTSLGASDPFTAFASSGPALPVGGFDPITAGLNLASGLLGGGDPGANLSNATAAPVSVPINVNVGSNTLNSNIKTIVIVAMGIMGGVALAKVVK